MFKKAKCAFLATAALFSGACLAETQSIRPNMTFYFNFNPNEPQTIKNPLWFTVSANCTVESNDPSNNLKALMLKNSGMVNDIELTENNSLVLTVHSGETFKITANAYAWVEITNVGDDKQAVKAVCTT